MSDVLAGMSRKEAEALVAKLLIAARGDTRREREREACIEHVHGNLDREEAEQVLALAALGARCVGAETRTEPRWRCSECGFGVSADEDGLCVTCGGACTKHKCRVLVLEGE